MAVLALLCVSACSLQATAADLAVFEALLEDAKAAYRKFLDKPDLEFRFGVHKETSGQLFKLCVERLREKLKDESALRAELLEGLRARNLGPNGAPGTPVDISKLPWGPNNKIGDLGPAGRSLRRTEMGKPFPGVLNVYQFELPGYSRDGKTAAVFAWIGPTHIHSVHNVALLKLENGNWRVIWRESAYYV